LDRDQVDLSGRAVRLEADEDRHLARSLNLETFRDRLLAFGSIVEGAINGLQLDPFPGQRCCSQAGHQQHGRNG